MKRQPIFKILTAAVVTLSLLLSLTACGGDASTPSDGDTPSSSDAAVKVPDSERYQASANLPVFVQSKSDFADPAKQYVLPDGTLWKTDKVTVVSEDVTNHIDSSVDEQGKTVGLIRDQRYGSGDVLKACEGACATGFIAVSEGDVVRFKGIQFRGESIDQVAPGAIYMRFYDESFQQIGGTFSALTIKEDLLSVATDIVYDEEGDVSSFVIKAGANAAYFRLSFVPEETQAPYISINQEFTFGEGDGWVKAGEYVSASWYEEVTKTIADVQAIKASSGGNLVQFLFNSDIHLSADNSNEPYLKDIGKVSAGVMQACNIAFFMNTGDTTTQSSGFTVADMQPNMTAALKLLEPVPQSNILLTVGNHDGATGSKEVDGEMVYYCYQLNNTQRAETYFGWQQKDSERHFAQDGTYFYVDDPETQTRFIMANSFWELYEGQEDGFARGKQNSFFHNPIFGQAQLDWLVDEALDVPEGYSVIIGTHNATASRDSELFKGIVNAYANKTTYSGYHEGVGEWQSSTVSADFSQAKGELIAIFQGHNHKDEIDTTTFAVPCITITTAGTDVRDEPKEPRVHNTSTATAVDVVTIDKDARTIYLSRLGVGTDRKVTY